MANDRARVPKLAARMQQKGARSMYETIRLKPLKVALVAVGLAFLGIYPLTLIWPSGWAWHAQGQSLYLQMIVGVYATLGVFMLKAARNPLENLTLIWFTVWSSVVHAGIMAIQSLAYAQHRGHLLGDVPALLIVAAVLGWLTPRRAASNERGATARSAEASVRRVS